MRRLFLALTALVATVALVQASATADPPHTDKVSFKDLDVEVADVDTSALPIVSYWKSGRVEFHQTDKVQMHGGAHTILAQAHHDEQAAGGDLHVDITDEDTHQETTYSYDPKANAISLAEGGESTSVVRNPDGSYLVDGAAAASGKAAAALVEKTAAWQATSPYGLLLAYTYAQNPITEVKQPTNCGGRLVNVARAPAVCTIFHDLCDCLACDASGKGSTCKECE